jgi:DNA-binding beta-propeller fold protein YncE
MRPLLAMLAGLSFVAVPAAASSAPVYRPVSNIALPDGEWDYASVDPTSGQLFVARANNITALDLKGGQAPRSLGTIAQGHAVVVVPGGRLAVTSGRDDSLRLFDQASGTQAASIKVGKGPDAALRDPKTGDLVVMERGGTVSVVDPKAGKVIRTIVLEPGLEAAALDRTGTLFVNNEKLDRVDVVNGSTGAVLPPILLVGCEGPSGLAYDAKTDHLIAACGNDKAAVIDAFHRKLVGLLDIGKGPDAVILDPSRRLAFVPCSEDGTLVEIALDGASGPRVVATIKTEPGARTGALDPRSGIIYLPTARFGPPPADGSRPALIPGSVHLIVVQPDVVG